MLGVLVIGQGCAAQSDEASVASDQGTAIGNSIRGQVLHNMEWFFRTVLLPTQLGPDGRPTAEALERSQSIAEDMAGDDIRRQEIQDELTQALEDAETPLMRAYAGWVAALKDGLTRIELFDRLYVSDNFGDVTSPTPWQAIVAGYDWIPMPFNQSCPECTYEDLDEPMFVMEYRPPINPGDPPFLVNFLHNTGNLLPVDNSLCEEAAAAPVIKEIQACEPVSLPGKHVVAHGVLANFEKESRRAHRVPLNTTRSRVALAGVKLHGLTMNMRTQDTVSLRFTCQVGTPSIFALGGAVQEGLATLSGTPMTVLHNDQFTRVTDRLPDAVLSCGEGNPVVGAIELWVEPGPHTGILCWKYSIEFSLIGL